MAESEMYYIVRHRRFLTDWSKVIILCEDWPDAVKAAVETMNSSEMVAEVSIYDQLSVRTSSIYPAYEDGERVPLTEGDVK